MTHKPSSLADRVLLSITPDEVSTIISRAVASAQGAELHELLVNSGISAGVEKLEVIMLNGLNSNATMLKNVLGELEEAQRIVAQDPDTAEAKLSQVRTRVAEHLRTYVDNVLAAMANQASTVYGMQPETLLAPFPPDEETEKTRKEYAACAFVTQAGFFGWVDLVMSKEPIVDHTETCGCIHCLTQRTYRDRKPTSEHMENAIRTFGSLEEAMRSYAHSRIERFKQEADKVTDAFGNLDVASPESIQIAVSGILAQIGGAQRPSEDD